MELVGQGVQLLGEDKLIGPDGSLANKEAKPGKASLMFTSSFTQRYPDIAAKSAVYAQMRNLIDMLVAAAFVRQQDYYAQANWSMSTFGNKSEYKVQAVAVPKTVTCVANAIWKGNRMLAPAGGGVSIQADMALDPKRLLSDQSGKLAAEYGEIGRNNTDDHWWWD